MTSQHELRIDVDPRSDPDTEPARPAGARGLLACSRCRDFCGVVCEEIS